MHAIFVELYINVSQKSRFVVVMVGCWVCLGICCCHRYIAPLTTESERTIAEQIGVQCFPKRMLFRGIWTKLSTGPNPFCWYLFAPDSTSTVSFSASKVIPSVMGGEFYCSSQAMVIQEPNIDHSIVWPKMNCRGRISLFHSDTI